MKYIRFICMLFICVLILSACAAPATPAPLPTAQSASVAGDKLATITPNTLPLPSATAPNSKLISRNGVQFTLPAALGTDATSTIIPEILSLQDGPPSGNPAYMQFKIQGYPVPGSEYVYAEIRIYDAKAYAADFSNGAENSADLNKLLAKPDEILTQENMASSYLGMASNMKRVFSADLKGIRMLSVHGNGMPIVTNNTLAYQFHGLSADEKFYIIVNLPVTAPFLPASFDSPAADGIIKFPENGSMDAYLDDVSKRLEIAEISGKLSPAPALMDALVQSLKIDSAQIVLPAPLPTNEPVIIVVEPTVVAIDTTSTPNACFAVDFVADVTYPDGAQVNAGEAFTKTWRIKNTGSCSWDGNYTLAFIKGDQMNATSPAIALGGGNVVLPGGTVDVSIPMQAPNEAGNYLGYWVLLNAAGENEKTSSGNPFQITVNIVVP